MTTQTIKFHMKPETFKQNAAISLQDKPLRKSLRTAMDMLDDQAQSRFVRRRRVANLRDLCEHVRQRSLSKLPTLLEQLEENLTKLGRKSTLGKRRPKPAESSTTSLLPKRQADGQSKSMVREEIELNHYLEAKALKRWKATWASLSSKMAGENRPIS